MSLMEKRAKPIAPSSCVDMPWKPLTQIPRTFEVFLDQIQVDTVPTPILHPSLSWTNIPRSLSSALFSTLTRCKVPCQPPRTLGALPLVLTDPSVGALFPCSQSHILHRSRKGQGPIPPGPCLFPHSLLLWRPSLPK